MWSSKSVLIFYRKILYFENFRNSSFWKLIFHRIIGECHWCYKWCRKQHSIIVAGFQQNCCFSATNVDFSGFCTFIQVKIEIWMKKQHLLPKNNIFVENQQQWCYVEGCRISSRLAATLRGKEKLRSSFRHSFVFRSQKLRVVENTCWWLLSAAFMILYRIGH